MFKGLKPYFKPNNKKELIKIMVNQLILLTDIQKTINMINEYSSYPNIVNSLKVVLNQQYKLLKPIIKKGGNKMNYNETSKLYDLSYDLYYLEEEEINHLILSQKYGE